MSKEVEYGGRTWCHQQMHGLMKQLLENGTDILLTPDENSDYVICSLYMWRNSLTFGCDGSTIWLALVGAIEKMNGGER